jgi:peroxiredoxin
MKYGYKIIALFLLISVNAAAQEPASTIPDFTFYTFNKIAFTEKDLAKGKLLFFIFFDTECVHCQHAILYVSEHEHEFDKTAVYLISQDGPEKVNRFMMIYGNNLTGKKNISLLQDTKYDFISKFKPKKYPSIFLYSAKRKLIRYDDNEKNLPEFLQKIKVTGK